MFWKKLDLEVSLKPFADHSEEGIRRVGHRIFSQWRTLIENADLVSLMFWAADGSEILDYNGKMTDRFEWAKWIGVANPQAEKTDLPLDQKNVHEHPRYFMENPPEFTYGDLKRVLSVLKQEFREMYPGRVLRLGATFDSGPEFAISDFKYRRHPEVCRGFCLGDKAFVCCYMTLHGDDRSYAGFPDGIPEGTSLGTFLGRQAQHFLTDLGFDYLWLSNGFGFGMETWGVTGALFDGQKFSPERAAEVKTKISGFWHDFRKECPSFPLETRGTNLSTGMDLTSDATPTREIYREVSDLEVPVNSPWAALNGDFGMELAGWMSHIAELPAGKGYPFRYYLHDPWFINSPWIDRYGRSPYDIYLPLSITRMRGDGSVEVPNALHFLTIDDSYGQMPDVVPIETTHFLYDAETTLPDSPGPLVWIYPFDEYHDEVYAGRNLEEIFGEDYLIRGAINCGFPLNTVISSGNFLAALATKPEVFRDRILIAPTTLAVNNRAFAALRRHVEEGGRALLYGAAHAEAAAEWLELVPAEPVEGEFSLEMAGGGRERVRHLARYSSGALDRVLRAGSDATVWAEYHREGIRRPAALVRCAGRGLVGWVCGTNSFEIDPGSAWAREFRPEEFFPAERLMRKALEAFGYSIEFHKVDPLLPDNCLTLRYCRNALYLVGFAKNTTGDQLFRFPDGAPLFSRSDAVLCGGRTSCHSERAVNLECRIFVSGDDSVLTCRDVPLGYPGIRRVMHITGLRHATVVFRPETLDGMIYGFAQEQRSLWGEQLPAELQQDGFGPKFVLRDLTGDLFIRWGVRHEFCASDR